MSARALSIVDVFTESAYLGNPVAVVHDGDNLSTEEMQRYAHWMNLSETTYLLAPVNPAADYRVRIFTPVAELPFAGHPTLGSAHAWLAGGGSPRREEAIVQECAAGLIELRRGRDGLSFAAPELVREGPVAEELLLHIAEVLRIARSEIIDAQWVDNGPGWVAVMLAGAEAVLALRPGLIDVDLGVVGAYAEDSPQAFEVRAFFPKDGAFAEDPVTGSLNASLAQWLIASGRAQAPYTVSQGTALGRAGQVRISQDADDQIWVGGGTITCVRGTVEL